MWHSASLDSESSYPNESASSSVHHRLPPRYPPSCSHLPRSLQLALVQVDAPWERVACRGHGDTDHPSAPRHVRVARSGASGTGGALDRPSSWRRLSVSGGRRMHYFFFIIFHFTARASAMGYLCCGQPLPYIACVPHLPQGQRSFRTTRAAAAPLGSSPPGHTLTSYHCRTGLSWHHSQSYSAAARYSLTSR